MLHAFIVILSTLPYKYTRVTLVKLEKTLTVIKVGIKNNAWMTSLAKRCQRRSQEFRCGSALISAVLFQSLECYWVGSGRGLASPYNILLVFSLEIACSSVTSLSKIRKLCRCPLLSTPMHIVKIISK